MASFVSTSSDEEQFLELAKYINKLQNKGKEGSDAFYQEIEKLYKDKKESEVLNRLIDESSVVFGDAEKDIEGLFLVIASLAKKITPTTASIAALSKIQSVLTSNVEDKPSLRLKLLNDLYNIVDIPPFRYNLFLAIIKFANASHNSELVIKEVSSEQRLNTRIKQWGINTDQIRSLYKLVRDTFRDNGRSLEAYQWSVKFLSTFDSPDASQTAEAAAAVLEAIKQPDLLQFDVLLDLTLVKQLESSKEHSKLFQLLKIFVGEHFEVFKAFIGQNADYLKSIGLKEEECTFKMRLLSLATLGAAAQEVSYSLIAKTLQLDESEVESWVITAMSEDVLEAKMDQLRRVVTISRCLQRVFTQAQWKQLSDNLANWRNNTQNILKTLQETKQLAFKQK